jgi:hypothetical protein
VAGECEQERRQDFSAASSGSSPRLQADGTNRFVPRDWSSQPRQALQSCTRAELSGQFARSGSDCSPVVSREWSANSRRSSAQYCEESDSSRENSVSGSSDTHFEQRDSDNRITSSSLKGSSNFTGKRPCAAVLNETLFPIGHLINGASNSRRPLSECPDRHLAQETHLNFAPSGAETRRAQSFRAGARPGWNAVSQRHSQAIRQHQLLPHLQVTLSLEAAPSSTSPVTAL